MTNGEYNAVAGRFMTVERGKDYVIIGLLGSLYKGDLTGDQLRHIKTFCAGRPYYKHYWLTDYAAPINASMYNNYMYIDMRNPLPDTFNKYQREDFWRACTKIDSIESREDYYDVLWDLGYYGEEVVNAARDYMGCMCVSQYE